MSLAKWWRATCEEISADIILRITGLCLALTHLVTIYFWYENKSLVVFSANFALPVCHGFFLNCSESIHFESSVVSLILILYTFFAVTAAVLFSIRQRVPWAVFVLGLITIFKFTLFISRYNLMGNYHLVAFFMTFTFLFLPKKRTSLTLCLILIYVLAGSLKLNTVWLSGSAILASPLLSGKWLSLGLAYVVVLELFAVWGLLSNNRWIRLFTLLQLFIFHGFSWHLVGYYYPVIMFLLLTPLFLASLTENDFKISIAKSTAAVFAAYCVFNWWPYISKLDPAMDGTFRGLRINMMDSRLYCEPEVFVESGNKTTFIEISSTKAWRTRCDPTVFETQLRKYCQFLKPDEKLNFALYVRQSISYDFLLLRQKFDYCQESQ